MMLSSHLSVRIPQLVASCCVRHSQNSVKNIFAYIFNSNNISTTQTKLHIAITMQLQLCIAVPHKQTAFHTQISLHV